MNAPDELSRMITSLEGRVSADEWQARLDLAAAYRLVALFRWDDLVFTHITAKIPGTEHFLINPYGLMFDEITASSLVKIDIEGKVCRRRRSRSTRRLRDPQRGACGAPRRAVRDAQPHAQRRRRLGAEAWPAADLAVLIFVLASLGYTATKAWPSTTRKSRAWSPTWARTLPHHAQPRAAHAANRWPRLSRRCTSSRRAARADPRPGRDARKWRVIEIPGSDRQASARRQARAATLGTAPGSLIWPGCCGRLDGVDAVGVIEEAAGGARPRAKRRRSAAPTHEECILVLQGGGASAPTRPASTNAWRRCGTRPSGSPASRSAPSMPR